MAIRQTCIKDDNLDKFYEVITEEIYRQKSTTIFYVMYDDETGTAYGCLGYEKRPLEIEITYLYVNPAYRRQGVGTDLLNTLTGFSFESPVALPIYARIPMFNRDETGLLNFFEMQFNFDVDFSNFVVSFNLKQLKPGLMKAAERQVNAVNFFDLPDYVKNNFLNFLEENDLLMIDDRIAWENSCAKKYCKCVYQNNEITSFVCVTDFAENVYEIAYVYTKETPDELGVGPYQDLITIMTKMLKELAAENFDALIQAEVMNEDIAKLCMELFTGMNIMDMMAIANWDYMPGIKDLMKLEGV